LLVPAHECTFPSLGFPSRLNWAPRPEVVMQKRILVIDDSDLVRGLVRKFIESTVGFEVCGEASDGLEGVEKGLDLKPDLIVLDYSMPQLNGLQTAVILHEVVPDTPIILFTFFKDTIPMPLARAAGVTSVVSKTDPLTMLAEEVRRLTA
jgi:DNA-binding NarL/FixJ family response regulator